MKLELGPDLQQLRIRARQRIADAVEQRMPSALQTAIYVEKHAAALKLLNGGQSFFERIGWRKRQVPDLLVAEAARRGITPIDLATQILERAKQQKHLREQIELHRVDFVMRLQEATSERDIQTLEAEMMTKLAALRATT